jgi:hypothetical protein
LTRLVRDESGQVLAITAIFLAALLGAAALAIDVGSFHVNREGLQQLADASSFAGARLLALTPNSVADTGTCNPMPDKGLHPAGYYSCQAAITNLSGMNVTNPQISWSTDYLNVRNQMEVTVTANSQSIFAGVFGIGSSPVTATSAAVASPNTLALFAEDSNCSQNGIDLKDTVTINGAVESNGSVHADNSGVSFSGPVGYGQSCGSPTGGTYNGTPPTFALSSPLPYPKTWSARSICSTPGATTSSNAITLPPNASGIYCSRVSITTNQTGDTENVTLVSPNIQIIGQSQTFTPYTEGLLFYQTNRHCSAPPCSTMQITDNGASTFNGAIYAPNQDVDMTTSGPGGTGLIEGYDITISDNAGFDYTGNGPTIGLSNPEPARTVTYSQ